MRNRKHLFSLILALLLLLTTPTLALFGKTEKIPVPEEGAPIAKALTLAAYRDIPCSAEFLASDDERGDLSYEITREPKRGELTVDGKRFSYTPKKTGKDSFDYVAKDAEGRCSLPATVSITVSKAKTDVRYADMDGSPAATAALRLAETGIFTGAKVGDSYFFEPERTVSRGEFLAMTMEMAELTGEEGVTLTGFSDDASIPVWAKSYAASALKHGVVQGVRESDGAAFAPSEPITMNEAATVLNRILAVTDVNLDSWFTEEGEPTWAAQAVLNMESVCVVQAGSFGTPAVEQPVTRAGAAQMLAAAKELLTGEKAGPLNPLGK